MTPNQFASACPKCGSAKDVHTIGEAVAQLPGRLGAQPPAAGPGWAGQPQQGPVGGPQAGWTAEPQQGPVPGYGQQPHGGAFPAPGPYGGPTDDPNVTRVQQLAQNLNAPRMARMQQVGTVLAELAQRHPDLCTCSKDNVLFLAGNHRTAPAQDAMMALVQGRLTLEQADQMVTALRDDAPAGAALPSLPSCPQCGTTSPTKVRTVSDVAATLAGALNIGASVGDAMGRGRPGAGSDFYRRNDFRQNEDLDDVISGIGADLLREGMRGLMRKAGQRVAAKSAQRAGEAEKLAEIGRRHPDLMTCADDKIVFLTNGRRTVPATAFYAMPIEQEEAVVAQLRQG